MLVGSCIARVDLLCVILGLSLLMRCHLTQCCCRCCCCYRPLLVYIVMELLTLLCHVALLATGFRLRQIDDITYYTYRVGPQMFVPAIRYDTHTTHTRGGGGTPQSNGRTATAAAAGWLVCSLIPVSDMWLAMAQCALEHCSVLLMFMSVAAAHP